MVRYYWQETLTVYFRIYVFFPTQFQVYEYIAMVLSAPNGTSSAPTYQHTYAFNYNLTVL